MLLWLTERNRYKYKRFVWELHLLNKQSQIWWLVGKTTLSVSQYLSSVPVLFSSSEIINLGRRTLVLVQWGVRNYLGWNTINFHSRHRRKCDSWLSTLCIVKISYLESRSNSMPGSHISRTTSPSPGQVQTTSLWHPSAKVANCEKWRLLQFTHSTSSLFYHTKKRIL